MRNADRFSVEILSQMGIVFEKEAEAESFASFIEEELEVRIGRRIGENLTDAEMLEFERISGLRQASDWLDAHCPDYRSIVNRVRRDLEDELLRFREKIPGVWQDSPLARNGLPVEHLDLSARTLGCLRKDGIRTLGQLAAVGDLTGIHGLKEKGIRELETVLNVWYPPDPDDAEFICDPDEPEDEDTF